jgi:hypothetical protein
MRQFDLPNFAYSIHELTKYIWLANNHAEGENVHPTVTAEMEYLIDQLARETKQLQLNAAHTRAVKELRMALVVYGPPTWGVMRREFQVFWEIIAPELWERRGICIENAKAKYLDDLLGGRPGIPEKKRKRPDPVWASIWKQFPSAQTDCEEAVYCYALERDTASVFHSMRVAEIGLRALARRMKVKLPKNKRLEWAQWQEILKEMSAKTDVIAKTAKAGPVKDALLEFYNGAIGQFYGFKDEFRNQVMHVRKKYDAYDSERALVRVRDFMEKLAGRIDEKGRKVKT